MGPPFLAPTKKNESAKKESLVRSWAKKNAWLEKIKDHLYDGTLGENSKGTIKSYLTWLLVWIMITKNMVITFFNIKIFFMCESLEEIPKMQPMNW